MQAAGEGFKAPPQWEAGLGGCCPTPLPPTGEGIWRGGRVCSSPSGGWLLSRVLVWNTFRPGLRLWGLDLIPGGPWGPGTHGHYKQGPRSSFMDGSQGSPGRGRNWTWGSLGTQHDGVQVGEEEGKAEGTPSRARAWGSAGRQAIGNPDPLGAAPTPRGSCGRGPHGQLGAAAT